MMKNRNNGPLFIAPRDEFGNKMIWDEDKNEYIVNEALYAKPLLIAPRDSKGNKMIWNEKRHVYESNETGQVFSTISMGFVAQRRTEPEDFMEDEALCDENVVYDDYDMLEDDMLSQYEEEAIRREEEEEAERLLLEELLEEEEREEEIREMEERRRIEEEEFRTLLFVMFTED